METKGGKKSKKSSVQYESPLGYGIEDVRPHGGSEKFRTAAYSNVRVFNNLYLRPLPLKVPFSAINLTLMGFSPCFLKCMS
jgi:S-adenosylmethionine decarboxylase